MDDASKKHSTGRSGGIGVIAAALCLTLLAALAGCGDKGKDKPASQTAAKVNKEEITVHQINFLLQQQRGLPPEQAASASRQILQRLIDQEVALQKAQEERIDRDPQVVQEIEAARREIIARAYVERLGSGAPHPSNDEIAAYYQAHPALFQNRRIYNLQEIAIEATPAQVADLKKKLEDAKNVGEFVDGLKTDHVKFAMNQAVRAAEQLPLSSVEGFSKMKDGESLFNVTPTGAQVVVVAASTSQPVLLDRARPAIDQFIVAERRRKLVEDDIKTLRSAARIELIGDFAKPLPAATPVADAPSEPALNSTRSAVVAASATPLSITAGAVDAVPTPRASRIEPQTTPSATRITPAASDSAAPVDQIKVFK